MHKKPCREKCKKFAIKPKVGISPYDLGLVRCKVCKIYLEKEDVINGLLCPCCENMVRTHPKNKNRNSRKIVEAQLCH